MQTIPHKRGDTFLYNAALTNEQGPFDITNVSIRCHIRQGDNLIAEAVIAKQVPGTLGLYSIRVDDTTAWPTKVLQSDIEYTINGQVISSETFEINCQRDITRT